MFMLGDCMAEITKLANQINLFLAGNNKIWIQFDNLFGNEKMAGALSSRFSLATANITEELKNSSKNENTTKSTLFWLSVWRKLCVEKKIESEIQSIPPEELNILLERFYAKVKK